MEPQATNIPADVPVVDHARAGQNGTHPASGAVDQSPIEALSHAGERPEWLAQRAARRRAHHAEWDFLIDATMLALATLLLAGAAAIPGLAVEFSAWTVAQPFATLACLAMFGLYRMRIARSFLDDLPRVIAGSAVAVMAVTFIHLLFVEDGGVASEMVPSWAIATGLLLAGRGGMALAERRARVHGTAGAPTLVVGAGRVGHLMARRLLEKPEVGLRPVAFVDDDPMPEADLDPAVPRSQAELPVFDSGPELGAVVRELGIEHAIIGFTSSSHELQLDLSRRLHDLGVTVSVVPRLFEAMPDRVVPQRTVGMPLVSIFPSSPQSWRMTCKYALDRVMALVAIMLLSPLLIALALAVLVSVGPPILYRQRRMGLDGRQFDMLKLRTMRAPGEIEPAQHALHEAFHKGLAPGGVEGEDRRTRVGGLLRRTGLDELPQLFNVVRGEMSIVGPRPEREELVSWFESEVYRYRERHRVKPGITGWAQVHGLRGKTSLSDRVEWDNYYIENWSPWLDFKILLLTLGSPFQADIE